MRWERLLLGCSIALALPICQTFAQSGFTCGSTGANGALSIAAGQTVTLNVPDDGVFNYTTITVTGTVLFNRNARFNPPVTLLATGDVVINSAGSIRVNGTTGTTTSGLVLGLRGQGGPGGFDGGPPGGGVSTVGYGPGAGGPGQPAAYGSNPGGTAAVYGSPLLVPLAGGSGGGGLGFGGGGGGGGAILLCSPTQVFVNGTVQAMGGGTGGPFGGSGGAIRIVAPVVKGPGSLSALGAAGSGQGRIRIDALDWSGLPGSTPAASVGSFMAVSVATKLYLVRVAGNDIPPGTPGPLAFTLPPNSPATQPITVRAEGFTGVVPVAIVVTPETGNRIVVNTQIDADASPPEVTVNVEFPLNVTVWIHAWTR